jgi:GST-like protein
MYTLFGSKGSGSAAAEAALVMAGLPFRSVRAATWEADSALDELRRVNPLGQIPTLVTPDGSVLTESAAIIIALGLEHPAAGLLPADAAARAQAIRGLVYLAANCYSAIGVIDYPERWCADADEATLECLRQGARQRLHQHWTWFADQFPAAPFLAGTAPGGLDVLAAVVSRWSGARAHLREQRPALYASLLATDAHPSVAAVFAGHWASA